MNQETRRASLALLRTVREVMAAPGVLSALLLALAFCQAGPLHGGQRREASSRQAAPPDAEEERIRLVARLERTVVLIRAEGREIAHEEKRIRLEPSEWLGAGFLIGEDGLVLTAAHVVAAAEKLRVKIEDREPVAARVVFADEAFDVALVRLEPGAGPLAVVTLGDSDAVRTGQTVYVIGNPNGIERSLSAGVVSGRHPAMHVFGGSLNADLIQTDAAINSGNSGGPIFNSRGEVIAMAQSILTTGGGSEGLGFGLAINAIKKMLGLEPSSWLGFSSMPLDESWAAALNVPRAGGLLVRRVVPGSPAEKAGLRAGSIPVMVGRAHLLLGGDVILKIGSLPPLEWTSSKGEPGAPQVLSVLREGRELEIPITPARGPRW